MLLIRTRFCSMSVVAPSIHPLVETVEVIRSSLRFVVFRQEYCSTNTSYTFQVHNDIDGATVYMNTFDSANQNDLTVNKTTITLQRDSTITPTLGYAFYVGNISTNHFVSFDLYANISGQTYTEDFRQTYYIPFAD